MNSLADSSIVLYRNETNKDHSGRFLAERRDLPLCFTGVAFSASAQRHPGALRPLEKGRSPEPGELVTLL